MQPSRNTIVRRFLLWLVVASISAAPSFWIALQEGYDGVAMVMGVLAYVVFLTALTCNGVFERIHARRGVRVTLYIGYGTRVLLSIAWPVMFFADAFPGMVALGLVELVDSTPTDFGGTLLTTLVQGTLLNLIVCVYMLLVFPIAFGLSRRTALPEYACATCGYDLRGSAGASCCSECGTEIPESKLVPIAPPTEPPPRRHDEAA